MRLYTTVIFLIILLTIAFIFGSQNNQILTLNYLIAKTDMTVALAVSIFTGLGFFLGLCTAFLYRLVRKLKTKQINK